MTTRPGTDTPMPPAPVHPAVARVCLGGTFDPFHVGHRALLHRAMQEAGPDGEVFIGLVADHFSQAKRARTVAAYDSREATIRTWWDEQNDAPRLRIRPLADKHGPSASGDYDVIVASAETAGTAREVNKVRADNQLTPLRVSVVPYVLGADLLPVSATRIAAGLIDDHGQRTAPLRVAAGTANPVKVDAIRAAFARWMPQVELDVRGHPVLTGVAEQPWGNATIAGADARARGALQADPHAEYGIGLEAGLFDADDDETVLDVQHCVILDRHGFRTHGHGPGFAYPPAAVDALRDPDKTVTDVIGPLAGAPDIGRTTGAVGWLTDGRLDRTRLSEGAVEAALVPRVRRELYA